MLECGKNYKGTLRPDCDACNCIDDEDHRLNHCIKFRELNYYDDDNKIPFETVHSNDLMLLKPIIERIGTLWNVGNGHGTINNNE